MSYGYGPRRGYESRTPTLARMRLRVHPDGARPAQGPKTRPQAPEAQPHQAPAEAYPDPAVGHSGSRLGGTSKGLERVPPKSGQKSSYHDERYRVSNTAREQYPHTDEYSSRNIAKARYDETSAL